jgi:transposase
MLLQNNDLRTVVKGSRKFANTSDGFQELERWIQGHKKFDIPVHLTMEATSSYHENVAFYFDGRHFTVHVVLPNKAKKYLQSLGSKSKNDKMDARGLAQMGAQQQLMQWKPFSATIYTLRALTRYCEQLSVHRTMYKNQLEALSHGMYPMEEVKSQLQELIDLADKQIDQTKKKIEESVKADKKTWERMEKIVLIKGLGIYSLATIVAETNGFELFDNERQLCSYAGYDVIEHQSGTRSGKTRISKTGNRHIRRILHLPALNVVRYGEKKFVRIYERIMSRHTKKMVAYVAIQRKLLALIYALWKKNEAYDPDYPSTLGSQHTNVLSPDGTPKDEQKSSPDNSGATQDELSNNEAAKVLFSENKSR